MIPKTVKVAGVVYTVNRVPFVEINGNRNYRGKIENEQARIEIMDGMSQDKEEQVFVHELVHAVLYEAGITDHDEDVVNRFGIVLHQVLKDNPGLIGIGAEQLLDVDECDCRNPNNGNKTLNQPVY